MSVGRFDVEAIDRPTKNGTLVTWDSSYFLRGRFALPLLAVHASLHIWIATYRNEIHEGKLAWLPESLLQRLESGKRVRLKVV
jgi:hypothetical protein